MFDWLFGNNQQKQLDQAQQQMRDYRYGLDSSREMAGAMDSIMKDPANKDLIATVAAQNPNFITDWTNQTQDLRRQANFGDLTYKDMQDQYNTMEKKNRYNYFGDGLIGALLNPIAQTGTAVGDLVTGQYGKNGRDPLSDLGAGVETALTFLPVVGGAAKAMKMGGGLAKTADLMNSTKGMIGVGGLFGGADALRQNGADTNLGDIATGAGTGAAFSAAIPFGAKMLRNRGTSTLSNAMAGRGMEQDAINAAMSAVPNKALYQTALKSYIPRTTFGKVALGGGLLYGGSKLLGGGQPQPGYNDGSMADPYGQYQQGMGY